MTRYFRFTNGGVVWPERKVGDGDSTHATQVVVIDFKDREQVNRLAKAIGATSALTLEDALQAALREFANPTPPKPDEPPGLGAVVEDADGERWVSIPIEGITSYHEWICSHSRGAWSSFDAVTVIHEGVQS